MGVSGMEFRVTSLHPFQAGLPLFKSNFLADIYILKKTVDSH